MDGTAFEDSPILLPTLLSPEVAPQPERALSVASVQFLSPLVISPGETAGGGRGSYSPGVI